FIITSNDLPFNGMSLLFKRHKFLASINLKLLCSRHKTELLAFSDSLIEFFGECLYGFIHFFAPQEQPYLLRLTPPHHLHNGFGYIFLSWFVPQQYPAELFFYQQIP